MAFQLTQYQNQDLSAYLFGNDSGIQVAGNIVYNGDPVALALLDSDITLGSKGSLASLRISRGIVLSTGSLVDLPVTNTSPGYGNDSVRDRPGDSDLLAAAQAGFGNNATDTFDAAVIEFDFTVTNPNNRYIVFDVVFASDEFPEFASNFVDIGAIIIDGVNYALFDRKAERPLSVLQSNIDDGYFLSNDLEYGTSDNATAPYAIEFDGLSYRLRISAELSAQGTGSDNTHHIKIGIADTNDQILDSAIFVSNIRATDVFTNILSEYDPAALTSKKLQTFLKTPVKSEGFFNTVEFPADALEKLAKTLGISAENLSLIKNVLNQGNVYEGQTGTKKVTISLYGGDDFLNLGSGADLAYGGDGDDVLRGQRGADKLFGQNGNDALYGGDGKDQLSGGDGNDTFYFDTAPAATNGDKIIDFTTGADRIGLSSAVFSALTQSGPLSEANFVEGAAALDEDDHVILSSTKLLYDADGSGSGKAILIASITGTVALTDIFVY